MRQGLWVIWVMYAVLFAGIVWGIAWLLSRAGKKDGPDDRAQRSGTGEPSDAETPVAARSGGRETD